MNLVRLDVSNNKLGGPIVTEIGLLSHLEVLHLNDNHLSGEVPTEIGKLTHLIELYMNDNDFSGSLPSELSKLVGLGELYILISMPWILQLKCRFFSDSLVLANNKFEGIFPIRLIFYHF